MYGSGELYPRINRPSVAIIYTLSTLVPGTEVFKNIAKGANCCAFLHPLGFLIVAKIKKRNATRPK